MWNKYLKIIKLQVALTIIVCGTCVFGQNITRKYSLITDLSETKETISSIKTLFEGIKIYSVDVVNDDEVLNAKDGLIILLSESQKVKSLESIITNYTRQGNTVFMDIRAFAELNNILVKNIYLDDVIVSRESQTTSGYKQGDPILYNANGELLGLSETIREDIVVLGRGENNDIVLVEQKRESGKIVAMDLLSLNGPRYAYNTENKYFFIVNTLGNKNKYGSYYPYIYTYDDFVAQMKEFETTYPEFKVVDEGAVSGGYKMFSINVGNLSGEGILIFSATHGNEWENAYGLMNFIRHLATHKDQRIIDLNKYSLKVIPVLNPYGYQNMTRQNENLVDLNRNGDYFWDTYTGADGPDYSPGSYDWKGTSPFSEPETQILKNITAGGKYLSILDVHGNPSGTGYNKWMGVANTTKTDAYSKGELFRDFFNESIKGRYLLRQERESTIKPFVIERIEGSERKPTIINSLSKDNYGYIVEVFCGYSSMTFIVTQSDITTELCAAFCKTFAPFDNLPDTTGYKVIKINFTTSDGASDGIEWNNITKIKADTIFNLKDSAGVVSPYVLYNEDFWDEQSMNGGVPGGPYPYPVCSSYWSFGKDKSVDLELRNLNNELFYDIEFFGARSQTEISVVKVKVDNKVSRYKATGNVNEKAFFRNVSPNAGVIRANIELDNDSSTANQAYLGAMLIREHAVVISSDESFNQKSEMNVYPNPVKETLYIRGTIGDVIIIYNVNGNKTGEYRITSELPVQVDLSKEPKGVYFIRSYNPLNEKIKNFKIIKY